MTSAVLALAGGVVAWALTAWVRRYALASALLDLPNARSSHAAPTPRGGGLAIAGVVLLGTALLGVAGLVPPRVALAVAGGGGLVAGVGWWDDRRGLPAGLRFVAHLAAAVWAVALVGGLPEIRVTGAALEFGAVGTGLAVLGVVWFTNLYNFMDGIDGLAAGEAVVVAGSGAVLLELTGRGGLALVAWLVAAASAGFLAWNWAPARIFMGDVGSGLLGFLFGVLAVASENTAGVPLVGWLILLAAFVFDATATLLRRALRGERLHEAHRSHAYQRAVQAGWPHSRVTGVVLALTVCLAVVAALATLRPALLPLSISIAVVLTVVPYWITERARPM